MTGLLAAWWGAFSAYFVASTEIGTGSVDAVSLVATIGAVALVVGVVLCVVWREVRALWMIPLVVLASLTPFVLDLSSGILGWVAVLFTAMVGVVLMLVGTGLVAGDATRRLPVWLLGIFALSMTVFDGFSRILTIVGA